MILTTENDKETKQKLFMSLGEKPAFLGIEHKDFVHPTPSDVKELRNLLGLTQTGLAKLTGMKWNVKRGSSAVQKWESVSESEGRQISLSSWQIMLLAAGFVTLKPLFKKTK